jgi:cation:H+ antiporter
VGRRSAAGPSRRRRPALARGRRGPGQPGRTSTRLGDYQLAVSDIFGGNAFLPVLFLVTTVLSGSAVLPLAHNTDIYLTGLGGLLTAVYMAGLVFRPQRQWLRMGPDSITVVLLYVAGIVGLALIGR